MFRVHEILVFRIHEILVFRDPSAQGLGVRPRMSGLREAWALERSDPSVQALGSGFRIEGSKGFRSRVSGLGLRTQGLGFRIKG